MDLAHAYGISKSKVKQSVANFYNNNFSVQRQIRRDAGLTIFNSDAKRQQNFTAYYWYKKAQRKRHRETICEADLKVGFAQLTPDQLHQCKLGASTLRNIVVGIKGEIERVMQHTNGVISWERLAQFIAGGGRQSATSWSNSTSETYHGIQWLSLHGHCHSSAMQ